MTPHPDYEDPFNARHADQIARATNSVFNEMCHKLDVKQFGDLVLKNLHKRSVSKERLCDWLQTVCSILNRYAAPHLQMAVDKVDKQKISLIAEQKTVMFFKMPPPDLKLFSECSIIGPHQLPVKSVTTPSIFETEASIYMTFIKHIIYNIKLRV